MAEMDAAQSEATALRNKEHEEYLKASKDYKDSAEAVANAIAVLQDYYSSGSFVQAKEAPELGGAKTDIASTIMSMLEVAESDFTSLLAEAEASEKEAQSNYDKLTEQNTITKTANTQEVTGKEASRGVGEGGAVQLRQAHGAEHDYEDGQHPGGGGQGGQREVGGDGPPQLQGGLRHDGQGARRGPFVLGQAQAAVRDKGDVVCRAGCQARGRDRGLEGGAGNSLCVSVFYSHFFKAPGECLAGPCSSKTEEG